jgi:hypothetical protein
METNTAQFNQNTLALRCVFSAILRFVDKICQQSAVHGNYQKFVENIVTLKTSEVDFVTVFEHFHNNFKEINLRQVVKAINLSHGPFSDMIGIEPLPGDIDLLRYGGSIRRALLAEDLRFNFRYVASYSPTDVFVLTAHLKSASIERLSSPALTHVIQISMTQSSFGLSFTQLPKGDNVFTELVREIPELDFPTDYPGSVVGAYYTNIKQSVSTEEVPPNVKAYFYLPAQAAKILSVYKRDLKM